MSDKISTALNTKVNIPDSAQDEQIQNSGNLDNTEKKVRNIITTEEELEAFFIVKNILKEVVPMKDIAYRDTESYMGILYKDNRLQWICRFILKETKKVFILPDENKKEIKFTIESAYDIEKYKTDLINVVKRYM